MTGVDRANNVGHEHRSISKPCPAGEHDCRKNTAPELAERVLMATLPDGQERLFTDRFSPKRWERLRKAINTPALKFHDLRKTFASLLAQRGVSTTVTQRLLEHSSPRLTNDVYTNVDPVLRQAVNQLPVADWL